MSRRIVLLLCLAGGGILQGQTTDSPDRLEGSEMLLPQDPLPPLGDEASLFAGEEGEDPAVWEGGELDALVVYSDKLQRSLFDTPTSTGLLDAARIEDTQVRSSNDAFRLLSNVRGPQFVDGGFVIRGVNSQSPDAENISGDQVPLSIIYVDGVALTQQASRRGPTRLWDVASFEVLRGPQSTLQGRNALAGSVNIITNDPELGSWGGAFRPTVGTLGTEEYAGMVNIPVGNALAFRFTYEDAMSDSFVSYPNLLEQPLYDRFVTSDFGQLRAKALFAPQTIPFTSKLTFSYTENRSALSDVFGPLADPEIDSFFDRLWLSGSGAQQLRGANTDLWAWENVFDVSDTLRLTALTGWTTTRLRVDQIDGFRIRSDEEEERTQEVRANWDAPWGRAVLGFYGNLADGASTQANIFRERNNLAGFGEIDLLLGKRKRWHLIGGGRVFRESYDFRSDFSVGFPVAFEEEQFLPKLGIGLDVVPGVHNVTFTYQRGHQSGGAGFDLNEPYTFDPSFTDHYELAWRSQVFDGRLTIAANAFYSDWFDQQVVVRDFDLASFNFSERIVNAAKSSFYGGEVELQAQPVEGLTLFASLGLLSTRFDEFEIGVDPLLAGLVGVPETLDYAGYEFPEAADFNGSIGFSWKGPHGFFLNADMTHSSSYFSPALFAGGGTGFGLVPVQLPQNEVTEVPAFQTVNLQAGYDWKNLKFTVFVTNLFDEDFLVGKVPGVSGSPEGPVFEDGFLATVGAPRFTGFSLEYRF